MTIVEGRAKFSNDLKSVAESVTLCEDGARQCYLNDVGCGEVVCAECWTATPCDRDDVGGCEECCAKFECDIEYCDECADFYGYEHKRY